MLDALGTRIASGALATGAVLTLDGIARAHAVSMPVAREAVRVLQSMGLVTSRRRVGVTVQPRSAWNVFDPRVIRWRLEGEDRTAQLLSLSELRRGFEPVAAALAAERATPAQGRALAAAVADMEVHGRSGDLEAYLVADQVFHRTLLEASGNEMIAALASTVDEVLAGRTHHDLMPARPNPVAIALHDEVGSAVRRGDAPGAERAMRRIIDEAADAMREEQGG
ncbi:FCD domain-containing protein [Nocardioides marmoribigeumensis]